MSSYFAATSSLLFCLCQGGGGSLWGHHDGMMRGCGSGDLGERGAGGDGCYKIDHGSHQCNTHCKAAVLLPAPKHTTISKNTTIQQVYIIKKLKNTSYLCLLVNLGQDTLRMRRA